MLWIASTSALSTADVAHAGAALWRIAGPDALKEIVRVLAFDAMQNPAVCLFAISVFGLLIYYRRRMRNKIQQIGELAAMANCYRLTPTIEALFFTLLIAAIWPGLLAYLSWRMTAALGRLRILQSHRRRTGQHGPG